MYRNGIKRVIDCVIAALVAAMFTNGDSQGY